jgi:uncharacterized membrane-anchored protein
MFTPLKSCLVSSFAARAMRPIDGFSPAVGLLRAAVHGLAVACLLFVSASPAPAQDESDDALKSFPWQRGPGVGNLNSHAEVRIPEGFVFAAAADTQKLLQMFGNPTSGDEVGLIGPESLDWFIVYEYDDCGYVKDDERDQLDADAMLNSIREGNEAGNQERKRLGFPAMRIVGWEQPPRYDAATQNLVWAIRVESENRQIVNYNTRRLGREGVMQVTLVVAPEELSSTIPQFESVMQGYGFLDGKRYADFKPGDRIAEYGLAALVTGGAAAVAAKTGLFKVIGKFLAAAWKLVIVALIAAGAGVRAIFSRKPASQ